MEEAGFEGWVEAHVLMELENAVTEVLLDAGPVKHAPHEIAEVASLVADADGGNGPETATVATGKTVASVIDAAVMVAAAVVGVGFVVVGVVGAVVGPGLVAGLMLHGALSRETATPMSPSVPLSAVPLVNCPQWLLD